MMSGRQPHSALKITIFFSVQVDRFDIHSYKSPECTAKSLDVGAYFSIVCNSRSCSYVAFSVINDKYSGLGCIFTLSKAPPEVDHDKIVEISCWDSRWEKF